MDGNNSYISAYKSKQDWDSRILSLFFSIFAHHWIYDAISALCSVLLNFRLKLIIILINYGARKADSYAALNLYQLQFN